MSAEIKLTPEITEIICEHIEKGNSYETAAQAVGIHRNTLHNWIERGEKDELDFVHFVHMIKKARAKAEMRYVAVIDKAANEKNWQAAAWWLERVNHKQWGKKDYLRQDINLYDEDVEFVDDDDEKDRLENKDRIIQVDKTVKQEDKPVGGGSGQQ